MNSSAYLALVYLVVLLVFPVESESSKTSMTKTATEESSSSLSTQVPSWPPATAKGATVQDLHREYNRIFRYGNRNAASHRWSTFLLERSTQMTTDRFELFFSGFCAVSGSPVRPSDYNRYRLTLPRLGGGSVSGTMHYCCWPCVCDTQDFIRIDTKNVTTRINEQSNELQTKQHYFAVIGNPCNNPEKLTEPFHQPFYGGRTTTLAETAQEVRCNEDGTLEGATLSDHGYVIISMFFDAQEVLTNQVSEELHQHQLQDDDNAAGISTTESNLPPPQPGRVTSLSRPDGSVLLFQDEREYAPQCQDRADNGYNSGMGEIFRKVCAISPISPQALSAVPATTPDLGAAASEPSCNANAADANAANGAATVEIA